MLPKFCSVLVPDYYFINIKNMLFCNGLMQFVVVSLRII